MGIVLGVRVLALVEKTIVLVMLTRLLVGLLQVLIANGTRADGVRKLIAIA